MWIVCLKLVLQLCHQIFCGSVSSILHSKIGFPYNFNLYPHRKMSAWWTHDCNRIRCGSSLRADRNHEALALVSRYLLDARYSLMIRSLTRWYTVSATCSLSTDRSFSHSPHISSLSTRQQICCGRVMSKTLCRTSYNGVFFEAA